MIFSVENPKDSTKKLLGLVQECRKASGYKINIQSLIVSLHANNEAAERQIKELISCTIALKTIKYLGINLTKEVKDQYTENNRGVPGWLSWLSTDLSSGHDSPVCGFEPHIGLCAGSLEPGACFRFCVSLFSLPIPCSWTRSLSLSPLLSLSKINKH